MTIKIINDDVYDSEGSWLKTISCPKNIFGEKHWLYANQEPETAKVGDDQFIFTKYAEAEGDLSLHLKGHQFYFLNAILKFENIELLVQPNNSSEKEDWNKPIFQSDNKSLNWH